MACMAFAGAEAKSPGTESAGGPRVACEPCVHTLTGQVAQPCIAAPVLSPRDGAAAKLLQRQGGGEHFPCMAHASRVAPAQKTSLVEGIHPSL
mmetsp:Transcript_18823/g.36937  ORF Transcript_18823/g.36937 Transcript_18823/m.36937 type:complete len:93 (-) Transcript_18823:1511-1789(-)